MPLGLRAAVLAAAGVIAASGGGLIAPAAAAPGPATAAPADAALAARAAGASRSDPEALARVERAVAELGSVRAEFVQELLDPRTNSVQRATGTLSIRKPGRFRWDYATPPQTIVSDGARLWLYDPDLEQVTVRRVGDALSRTPAMLLAGQGRVGDAFVVQALPPADGLTRVRLVPKGTDTDFRELRLAFTGHTLHRMEFEDRLNQSTRVTFTRIERNVALPDSTFAFVPPPGTDVIGAAR